MSSSFLVRGDRAEVGTLSRWAMALSGPLRPGLRFLRIPLPAAPSAFLALAYSGERASGLPSSEKMPERRRYCFSTGRASSASGENGAPELASVPFGSSLSARLAGSFLTVLTAVHFRSPYRSTLATRPLRASGHWLSSPTIPFDLRRSLHCPGSFMTRRLPLSPFPVGY